MRDVARHSVINAPASSGHPGSPLRMRSSDERTRRRARRPICDGAVEQAAAPRRARGRRGDASSRIGSPALHLRADRRAATSMPTAGSIDVVEPSRGRRRAPRPRGRPASARMRGDVRRRAARRRRRDRAPTAAGCSRRRRAGRRPGCAMISRNFSSAGARRRAPSRTRASARGVVALDRRAAPACAPRASTDSDSRSRRAAPLQRLDRLDDLERVADRRGRAARPSSVISASVRTPAASPMATSDSASCRASLVGLHERAVAAS